MTGSLTAIVADTGTLVSETPKACTYTFPRSAFFGDWEQLVLDFGGGAPIRLRYKPNPTVPNVAQAVQRLL